MGMYRGAKGLPPRKHSTRRKRTPKGAAKKQRKREAEGSGSRSSFRVRCCLSLMGTPAERPTPCNICRRKRYHVTYDAHPDPSRVKRQRDSTSGKTYTVYKGYYCEEAPTGVEFRDRAGDETSNGERVSARLRAASASPSDPRINNGSQQS